MRADGVLHQLNKQQDRGFNVIACIEHFGEKKLRYGEHAKRCTVMGTQVICREGFDMSSKSGLYTNGPVDNESWNRSTPSGGSP